MKSFARWAIAGVCAMWIVAVATCRASGDSTDARQRGNEAPLGASSASASSSDKGDEKTALKAANEWLAALKSRDAARLGRTTALPFSYKSIGKKKLCEGVVKDQAGIQTLVKCFKSKEKLFLGELKYADDMQLTADTTNASKSLMGLVDKGDRKGTLVTSFINGDGVTYTLLFVVMANDGGAPGVSSFALEAEFLE